MAKSLQAIYPVFLHAGKGLPNKSRRYIYSIFIIVFVLISASSSSQTTIQSVNDGSWNLPNIWDSVTIPAASDNVIINNNDTIKPGTTAEVNNLSISSSGKLVVEGTLIVNGNLNMADNGSQLVTDPGANVFIFKDANLANKVFINLSNYFIVLGNFSKSGSHNQGELTINNAHVYIFGTVDIPYQKDDPWQDFSLCSTGEYNGTTVTENDNCDAGDSTDFVNIVQPEDLPDGVYDRIAGCEEPSITSNPSISNFNYCFDAPATALTISATGDGLNYQWYRDDDSTPADGDETPVGTNNNSYTPPTDVDGTYYYYCIVSNNCGEDTSNVSGAITVNEFNMLVTDETPTPSGNHCPEFGGPFNANTESYNPGATEVIFKVEREFSSSANWTFDFAIDETGDVEVYDLVLSGNTSPINYSGDDAAGIITATDNTEVTFTFQIWNVPGTPLDVDFTVSNGNDGTCIETGTLTDNSKIHTINVMPVVGTFNP